MGFQKRLFQYTAVLAASLTTISCGFHFGWPSSNLPLLLSEETPIPMTDDESAWVAIIYLIGGGCGAIFTGVLLDILGRKSLLLLSSAPIFTSWMITAFADTLPELLIARFIAGMSEGIMYGTIPIYVSEISDPEIRGFLGYCITISYLFGIVLANVMGSYLSIKNAALICAAIPLLFLLIFIWMPETPYYLLLKGKKEQAKRSVMKLKRCQNIDTHLDAISNGIEVENSASIKFSDLFTKKYGKYLLMMMGIRATQQLSGYVAFSIYAQTIFEEAGGSLSPLVSVVIFYCVQITFSLLSSLFIDKLGRRPLLIFSITGSCLSLCVEGVYFVLREVWAIDLSHVSWIALLVLITFVISYSAGLQTMPVFMVSEIFPTNIKAYATAFSNLYYFIFASLVSKFFQYTKDEFGMYVSFFTFSACSILGLIFIVCCIPETKNKTLEEIQSDLQNKN